MTAGVKVEGLEDGQGIRVLQPESGAVAAILSTKDWETSFFGRKLGSLSLPGLSEHPVSVMDAALERVLDFGVNEGFSLIELHQSVLATPRIALIEDAGFRLVDTRATFLTKLDRREQQRFEAPMGEVRLVRPGDLAAVLALTSEGFTRNDSFVSRYKDHRYFTLEDTERWFEAWVRNHVESDDVLFAVWEVEGEVVGYYFYKLSGKHEGLPLYKGILSTVTPKYRGAKGHLFMQTFLYDLFEEDVFYLDNTTQLSNYSVIKNHIRSSKWLHHIDLTFFWSNPEP